MYKEIQVEKLKQGSNIWAMLSAAGYAAALFQGSWIWGAVFGTYAAFMSYRLIEKRIRLQREA